MSVGSAQIDSIVFQKPAKSRTRKNSLSGLLIALCLGLIILLAAFLRFYELGKFSVGNEYYAATVQSMLTSWHNFFYAAFEPGGSVTVDKPPMGFWVQAASAYIFGVNGFALALPNAVAGLLSVLLVYYLVKRSFGVKTGLLAALVLAVTPVTVSTERNNTIDGLLVFVLLLAAWAVVSSVQKGKSRYLFLGVILVGLGFNIKMLQAYMVLPALYALYFLGAPHRWWKRLVHLAGATILLLVVSLSWAVVVDLTPAENRPYIGSSTDNSVLELIFGHNGIRRLASMPKVAGTGGGGIPPAGGQAQLFRQAPQFMTKPGQPGQFNPGQLPQQVTPGIPFPRNPQAPANGMQPGQTAPNQPAVAQPGAAQGQGPDGRFEEVGEPGWLRLFTQPLVTEAGWLLPLSLLGIPIILSQLGWKWPLGEKQLAVVLWAGWLLPAVIYFTFTTGLIHAYYLIMLGPPLATLVGVSVWALWRILRQRRLLGWLLVLLITGATLAVQFSTLKDYSRYAIILIAIATAIWILGLALLPWKGNRWLGKAALALICLSLVVAPLAWSGLTTFNTGANVWLPRSGPDNPQASAQKASQLLTMVQQKILDHLLANTSPDSYLVATLNARQAAPYILATLRPVLTFGGFSGSDNVIGVEQLAQMVATGELRFVMGSQELERQKPQINAWVVQNCKDANIDGLYPSTTGPGLRPSTPASPGDGAFRLYDCGI